MNLIEYTVSFSAATEATKRVGTLSVGLLNRKFKIDRKGRKRRTRVEFESGLVSGGGNAESAISAKKYLAKELGGGQKLSSIPLTQEKLRKIVGIFKDKKHSKSTKK